MIIRRVVKRLAPTLGCAPPCKATTFWILIVRSMQCLSAGLDHTWWRKYESVSGRCTSPDPLAGSVGDPQSFNRYHYSGNDPVNLIDPTGQEMCSAEYSFEECGGSRGFWGGNFGGDVAEYNRQYGGMPRNVADALRLYNQRVDNAIGGFGFLTSAEVLDRLRGGAVSAHAWITYDGVSYDAGGVVYPGFSFGGDDTDVIDSTPVAGGLNPFFHPLPWRPPTVWKPSSPTELPQMEPATDLPGFPSGPHIGPRGLEMGPDQDLRYFREQGSSRVGARAGLREMTQIGEWIITIVSPATRFIDLAPIVVCGPCLRDEINRQRRQTVSGPN